MRNPSKQKPSRKSTYSRNLLVWRAATLQLGVSDALLQAARSAFDPRDRARLEGLALCSEGAAEALGIVSRRQRELV